jgi:hemoglobin
MVEFRQAKRGIADDKRGSWMGWIWTRRVIGQNRSVMGKEKSMSVATFEKPSLYEQLGGMANIEAVVGNFYGRILADESLQPMFANIDMDHLRRHQTRFLSFALGGPNQYTGRNMRRAHEGLGITEEQFNAVAGHLVDALATFDVPADLIDEVIGHVATLKGDVVGQ